MLYKINNGLVAIPIPLLLKLYPLPTRTANSQIYHIPTSLRDYHQSCTHAINEQCALGIFFLRLWLWQLLLKLLRIRFLNRSYPGTLPFRCRESRPYHEEPRLKTSFCPFLPAIASLFLHCSPMVTLTSLPALSLQHNLAYSKLQKKRSVKQKINCPCGFLYNWRSSDNKRSRLKRRVTFSGRTSLLIL